MRVAYLDCVGGISGDMFVGALLDAGWPETSLREATAWLGDEIAELRVEWRQKNGFAGKGIVVEPGQPAAHVHRGLKEVIERLGGASLPEPVRNKAIAVFRRLAEAEARAHGTTVDRVHFHEVGAVDAMVDVVGVCAGLVELGIERLHVSPLPLGAGQIEAAHGTIPLPAPATAFLVEGLPVRWTRVPGERCTPTGAALVATLGEWSAPPAMSIRRVGTGAGSHTFPGLPNITRIFVGETAPAGFPAEEPGVPGDSQGLVTHWDTPGWGWNSSLSQDGEEREGHCCPGSWGQVVVLETQIDDSTPEEISELCDRLRQAGGLEVFLQSVMMKKGRQGTLVTAICRLDVEQRLITKLLTDSTTLGVRRRVEWRRELQRRPGVVETSFGPVEVKLALRAGVWVGEPEFESCRRVALRAGVPLARVRRAALRALAEPGAEEPEKGTG